MIFIVHPCRRMAKLIGGRLCQAFTLLRADGTVVCWGNKVACGQRLGIHGIAVW